MIKVPEAVRVVSLFSCLFLLASCGFVYTRVTQSYANKESLSQAQAAQVIRNFTGVPVDEKGIYLTTPIKFADVWGIQLHGVVDTPGNLTITLLDKNDNAFIENNAKVSWTFHGSLDAQFYPRVAGNTSKNVQLFLSSLLVLCSNVK